ncbi:sugar porter family MFS transporter [Gulosibacter sp. 10]|uniref:sugar porter family MFS transporter n=1 Tax=Gulosibacter sp. 10 TaxID=1255570 RepID=UPI00097F66CB|nr:sugar porter family MFS transporter [Gulosibacter sp. 10]SJM71312.1 Major myo-inositol transporter IolT [Gulosibacter sp. 10]
MSGNTTGSDSGIKLPALTNGPHRKRLGLISIVACFGGLLFGYDTGVSNGAETPMQHELGLDDFQLGFVISSLVFAAAVGALICGRISDAWGRRKTIILLAVMFFLGTILVIFSPGGEPFLVPASEWTDEPNFSLVGYVILVSGRIMLGLAVGGASTIVPVYLAELAPFEIRGAITGRNEVAIVTGQLSAFVINAIIGNIFEETAGVWRIMFSICALPAIALFFGMLRMPESPRWLVEKGRNEEALAVLKTVRPDDRAEAELKDVQRIATEEAELGEKTIGIKAVLTNKWLFRIILIGIGVAMAQQLTGINSIMYYGTRILEEAGFSANAALIANIASGVAAVVGGFIALYNMDRLDRRKTFAIGLTLTTTCHLLIGIADIALPADLAAKPFVLLVLIVAFVFSMQTFLNVAVWVWLAEIFPLHMRGIGIGVSVFFGWTTNGFLALYVPSLISGVGITGTFFLFAAVGALALIFVIFAVPETRGRTLEALEQDVTTGAIHLDTKARRTQKARKQ